MTTTLQIGPLLGGGLVLGYRCPSRCRHCLYGSGPHRRDGEPDDEAALEALLDQLAERAPQARYHIGGGEPFGDIARLGHAIEGMAARGLALDYVETNASWARDRERAVEVLAHLAAVGLSCVLVSLSPFHAEFVPPSRTQALIDAARATLPGGAFVWIPELQADLQGHEPGSLLDLDALLAERGDRYARGLAERYGLVAGGRAGRYLHDHGLRRPWQEVARRPPCRRRLADTSHFHVDGQGRYVPGLCAGLVLPLELLPGEVDLSRLPIVEALVDGGPGALMDLARPRGFEPAESYSSACDLCNDLRFFLYDGGFDELGPEGYYDERSVPFSTRCGL